MKQKMYLDDKIKWMVVEGASIFLSCERPKARTKSVPYYSSSKYFTRPKKGCWVEYCRSAFKSATGFPMKSGQIWKRVNKSEWKLEETIKPAKKEKTPDWYR
jgi:hypothetical protein